MLCGQVRSDDRIVMSHQREAVAPVSDPAETVTESAEPSELSNKSVVKATILLNALGRHPQGITVTDLAQVVGMSRPTVFRLLLSLEQTGFVEREDNKYRLGWKIARLGRLADPHRGLISRLQPVLDALAEQLNEMIGYAVVNGDADFDLISEAHGSRLLTLSQGYVGRDFPMHASAMGKLILAEMPDKKIEELLPRTLPSMASQTITSRAALLRALQDVRQAGYAFVDDELEESLFALAVPVRDDYGRLVGALAVTGPSPRMKSCPIDELVGELRQGADRIAERLGIAARSAT